MRVIVVCLAAGLASPALADDASAWLARMNDAARSQNYDGVFVYQHQDQLEALRILHQGGTGADRERLVSLSGPAREIVRRAGEVRYYSPDERAVLVEQHRADRRFPALIETAPEKLAPYYRLKLGPTGRVAGRPARVVVIEPKDLYRYGYHLWADEATGLLLKAVVTDTRGTVLQQFMFTQLALGKSIAEGDLNLSAPAQGVVWHHDQPPVATTEGSRWQCRRLPPGFALTARVVREGAAGEQLVFSDGLAVVSVFVLPLAQAAEATAEGGRQRGALHAFWRRLDGHQVTVLGEVPQATVELLAKAVTHVP